MSTKPLTVSNYESPIGRLTLEASGDRLSAVRFKGIARPDAVAGSLPEPVRQLDEYFAGSRRAFELELDLAGTEMQLQVWAALRDIPYGETITYGELARSVGRPDDVRAVAGAVARTPTPIVIPCHRVIAADGSLTGYLGGLERKRALLDLEAGTPALL